MVYLVDDDVDDLQIIQEALTHNNYSGPIKTALNGQVLMTDLHKPNGAPGPAVIVLDLNMPLKNGFDVLREIKDNPSLSHIPVIILTASTSKNDEIRCMELGCAAFFRKPYNLTDYDPIIKAVKKFIFD